MLYSLAVAELDGINPAAFFGFAGVTLALILASYLLQLTYLKMLAQHTARSSQEQEFPASVFGNQKSS